MNESSKIIPTRKKIVNSNLQRPKPIEQRFWEKVDKASSPHGCWLWEYALGSGGYGMFFFRGRNRTAQRVAWIFTQGEIPDGLMVLHNCPGGDNPACVNPDHLFLGNQDVNMKDKVAKNRQAKGASNGNARLNEATVKAIRIMYAGGNTSHRRLAMLFSIGKRTVQQIVRRETWTHI